MPPKRQLTDVSKPEVREPKRLRVTSGIVPPPVTQSGDGTVPAPIIAHPFSPSFPGIAADDGMEVVPPSPTNSDGSLFGGYDDDDSDGSLFGGGHDEDATASDDADAHDSSPSYPEIALPYGPRVIHPLPRIRGDEAATPAHMRPATIARGVHQELSSNVGLLPNVTAQQQQESQGQAVTSVPMYAGAGLPAEQYINSQQMEQLNVPPSTQACTGQNHNQAQVAFPLYNPPIGQQFNPQQQVGQSAPTQTWPQAQAAYPSYSPPVGQYNNPQQYVEQSAPFQSYSTVGNLPASHSLFGGAGPQAGQFAVPPQPTDTLSHGCPQQPLPTVPTPQPPSLIDAGGNDAANASGHVYHVPHPSPQDEVANPPAAQIDVIGLLAGLDESLQQYWESNQRQEAAAASTQVQTIERSPVEFHGALDGQFPDPQQETYRRAHATSQLPTHALAGSNIMSQQPQNFGPGIGLNTHPSLVFPHRPFIEHYAAQNQATGFPWMGHGQVQNGQNQQGMVPCHPALFQRDFGPAQYQHLAMYAAIHAGAVGPQQRFPFGNHAPPHAFAPQLPVLPTMDVQSFQQQQVPLPRTNGTLSGKENGSHRRTGGSAKQRKSTAQSPDGRCRTQMDLEDAVFHQLNVHNNGQRLYDDGALMRARGYLPSLDLADVRTGRATEGEASTSTSVAGTDTPSEANGTRTKKRGGQTRIGRMIPNDVVCPRCQHVESRPDSLLRHFGNHPECEQRAKDEYNMDPGVIVVVQMSSIFLPKFEANFVDFLSRLAAGNPTPKRTFSVQTYVNRWWKVRAQAHQRMLPIYGGNA